MHYDEAQRLICASDAFSDLAIEDPDLATEGFPTLSKNDTPPCGATVPCTRARTFFYTSCGD